MADLGTYSTRYSDEIAVFEEWDRTHSFPEDPILFVGSSTIRLWDTAKAFPDKAVLNRGFGGAEFGDLFQYYHETILKYKPSKIVLYCGDNDIGCGKSGNQVFEDYMKMVAMIASDLPEAEIYFLSLKPTPLRWAHWEVMQEVNCRVLEHTKNATKQRNHYVDVSSCLLAIDGTPGDYYIEDGLHLNDDGYEQWRKALAPVMADW